jgi:hypothetical protein
MKSTKWRSVTSEPPVVAQRQGLDHPACAVEPADLSLSIGLAEGHDEAHEVFDVRDPVESGLDLGDELVRRGVGDGQ